MSPASLYHTAVITSIQEEAAGVKTITIVFEDGSDIPYFSGQFITLAFTHHGKEERRSYSISACHEMGEPLSFTVKRIDNGAYSRMLTDRAKPGDRLLVTGASGLFTLPANIAAFDEVFFFAAGIGITPVFSLIKAVLTTQPGKKVVLIYSNRTPGDVVFYNQLQLLATAHPNLTIEYLYSDAYNLMRARLNKSLVPLLLKEYSKATGDKVLCYVCGPSDYMRMVIYSLTEYGITTEQIKKENFNANNRQVVKVEPPDKAQHTVKLHFNKVTYRFDVQYPQTILQAAKQAGIALPYSCEVGRCGSCAAMCIKGAVWLSYNEVLMDSDLAHGSTLTCTGHPVGGDVELIA